MTGENAMNGKRDYYNSGSSELATETPLTVKKLETVGTRIAYPISSLWLAFLSQFVCLLPSLLSVDGRNRGESSPRIPIDL